MVICSHGLLLPRRTALISFVLNLKVCLVVEFCHILYAVTRFVISDYATTLYLGCAAERGKLKQMDTNLPTSTFLLLFREIYL